MESIARKVLQSARDMVPGHFKARPATPATHPHISWRDYDRVRTELEALGFRHLGDIDPISMPTNPAMSRANVMRILAGDDGTVTAAFYRIPLRWTIPGIMARLFGGGGGFLDLGTLYQDGTIVETSNASDASVWTDPPFLMREFLHRATPVPELVERHRERVRERAAAHPQLVAVRVQSMMEVVAASDAMERAKRHFRESIGWITRDELARLSRLSGTQLDTLDHAIRDVAARGA